MKIVYLLNGKTLRTEPQTDGSIMSYEFTLADDTVIEVKEDMDADSLSIRVREGKYRIAIEPVTANSIIVKGI